MILECSYCGGRMTVADSGITLGKPLKVRCPHCKRTGLVEDRPVPGAATTRTATPEPGSAQWTRPRQSSRVPTGQGPHVFEASLPSDAFKDFRFPSEEVERRPESSAAKRNRKILWLVALSLGTVLFLAALVNIILRGPAR